MYKAQKFSEEYACLLQEYISPEDYELAMKEYPERLEVYAYKPRQLPYSEIAREAKIVLDALGEELSSDEIADILDLGVMDVEFALREYSRKDTDGGND